MGASEAPPFYGAEGPYNQHRLEYKYNTIFLDILLKSEILKGGSYNVTMDPDPALSLTPCGKRVETEVWLRKTWYFPWAHLKYFYFKRNKWKRTTFKGNL